MERAQTARAVQVLLVEDHAPIRQAIASEFAPDPDFGAAAVLDKARHLGQVAQAVRRVLSGERLMPAEDGR